MVLEVQAQITMLRELLASRLFAISFQAQNPIPSASKTSAMARQILPSSTHLPQTNALPLACEFSNRCNGCRSDRQPPGGLQGGHRL